MNANKSMAYTDLVQKRKACHECGNCLNNPADVESGRFDSEQIGPWSVWQSNLNARLLVIGQDWGDVNYFSKQKGQSKDDSPSNATIQRLLDSIGIKIPPPSLRSAELGEIFMTNAILCLKQGGKDGGVRKEWFDKCGKFFLKPLITIIQPKVVVTLGRYAFRLICDLYNLHPPKYRDTILCPVELRLTGNITYIPVYHVSPLVLMKTRKIGEQEGDWQRIRTALDKSA